MKKMTKIKIKYIQFAKWFDKLPSAVKVSCYIAFSGILAIFIGYLPIINSIDDLRALQSQIGAEVWLVIKTGIINVVLHYKLKSDSKITEITE